MDSQILKLEKQIVEKPSEALITEIEEKKRILQQCREPLIKSVMIRSKARWVEHGEKPTKYFCILEKRNYVNKTITRLTTEIGESEEAEHMFFMEENVCKLDENDQTQCDQPLSLAEVLQSVKAMPNGKTPGSDGFPVDFYKLFWKDVGQFLHRSLCHALKTESLSITQGIITCLPKGDKPRQFLKNWRPITLLNVDYKIVSACLAKRLKTVLPSIISDSQKGFLKGRFIGENTRLVYDLINFLDKEQKPRLLLLVDFEKAFDTVEWPFINKILQEYHFGPFLRKWVNILYRNAESCVINNGHFSEFFKLGRGCRQGDPLSPYLFILAIEPLAMAIKNNPTIKGINIYKTEHKIGQYADDTFLMLDGTATSLKEAMYMFTRFEKCSGLRVNIDKTLVARLGTKVKERDNVCPELKLNHVTEFTLLGIQFSTQIKSVVNLNLDKKR